MPSGKITHQKFVLLSKIEEELPSTSDVANADDMELQEITENALRSIENLTAQLEGESSEDLPMHKHLRSI